MFHVFGSVAEFGKIIRDRKMARLELARVRVGTTAAQVVERDGHGE